jgi:hypothetical protein
MSTMIERRLYKVQHLISPGDDDDDFVVVDEGSLTEVVDVTDESPLSLALTASDPDLVSAVM